jgi:hypothetical protein
VFLVGIVGVPWQDIATEETLDDPTALEYLSADEISWQGLWDVILGEPDASPPVLPSDPFMRAQIEPRETGAANPRVPSIAIEAPRDGAGGNPINGHEYNININDYLQYACIFPLSEPRSCLDVPPGVGCDCKETQVIGQRPLCDGTTQLYAKAYPGMRFLQLLRDYGTNSIVASICPKNAVGSSTDPSYGYNPAMAALIDRIQPSRGSGSCLPSDVPIDDEGRLLCRLVEVRRPPRPTACVGSPGRADPAPELADSVLRHMRDLDLCGSDGSLCDTLSLCEILPAQGEALANCLNASDADLGNVPGADPTSFGYCYIDTMTDTDGDGVVECEAGGPLDDCIGNPEVVADCPATQRRLVRLVGPPDPTSPLPWPGSTVFIACWGPASW